MWGVVHEECLISNQQRSCIEVPEHKSVSTSRRNYSVKLLLYWNGITVSFISRISVWKTGWTVRRRTPSSSSCLCSQDSKQHCLLRFFSSSADARSGSGYTFTQSVLIIYIYTSNIYRTQKYSSVMFWVRIHLQAINLSFPFSAARGEWKPQPKWWTATKWLLLPARGMATTY